VYEIEGRMFIEMYNPCGPCRDCQSEKVPYEKLKELFEVFWVGPRILGQ